MTVILSGRPMVRFASSRRSPSTSSAARRWKIRLSQYSTCAKNRAVPASGVLTLPCREERSERSQPLLSTREQVFGRERIGHFLKTRGVAAFDECIRGLFKVDPFFPQP